MGRGFSRVGVRDDSFQSPLSSAIHDSAAGTGAVRPGHQGEPASGNGAPVNAMKQLLSGQGRGKIAQTVTLSNVAIQNTTADDISGWAPRRNRTF